MRPTGLLLCAAGAILLATTALLQAAPPADQQATPAVDDRATEAQEAGGALILSEPGDVEISIWITPTAKSQELRVQADSGSIQRDITIGLSGLDSPQQHSFTWWALPAGEYEVVGRLVDSDGASEIVVRSELRVLGHQESAP